MPEQAHALPSKQFFIHTITKDISLEDCILDLIDNCLDGANRRLRSNGSVPIGNQEYEGYETSLTLNEAKFLIKDNCGGIPVNDAIEYAFHFGRRPDAPPEADYSIGLYGIGMKRAIFKIGRIIQITSCTQTECFMVPINVPNWEVDPTNWDFDLERMLPTGDIGTEILVTSLNDGVGEEFTDQVFINKFVKTLARDYSFFLKKGFAISVNERPVDLPPFVTPEPTKLIPVLPDVLPHLISGQLVEHC